jgi:hypothetical protein
MKILKPFRIAGFDFGTMAFIAKKSHSGLERVSRANPDETLS